MNRITVVIADDHPVYRTGIRDGLDQYDDLTVTGEASNGREALDLVKQLQPDLLLLDMEMPELSGLDVARTLQSVESGTKVLPLSSYSDPEYVFGVLENGAEGYLMKDEPLDTIVEAIRRVMAGGVYMSHRVSLEIVNEKRRLYVREKQEDDLVHSLIEMGITPTLLNVLQLAARGLTNQEIADAVFRSHHTIRNHLTKIRELVGVNYRPALVAWAWRNDIDSIDIDEYSEKFH